MNDLCLTCKHLACKRGQVKKALAICKQHAHLAPIFERLHALVKETQDRVDFLARQKAKIDEDFVKLRAPLWDEVIEKLQSLGELPTDYSKDKYHFHYDDESDVLVLCDGQDHTFQAMLGLPFRGA